MARLIIIIGLALMQNLICNGFDHFELDSMHGSDIDRIHSFHGIRSKRGTESEREAARKKSIRRMTINANCLSSQILSLAADLVLDLNVPTEDVVDFLKPISELVCENNDGNDDCPLNVPSRNPVCDASAKYRTVNGECNNLDNPLWGAGETPYLRIGDVNYKDGIQEMRDEEQVTKCRTVKRKKKRTTKCKTTTSDLPQARKISLAMSSATGSAAGTDPVASLFLMQWGQFLDHDLAKTPESRLLDSDGNIISITCCPGKTFETPNTTECSPLNVGDALGDDPFFSDFGVDCRKFIRTMPGVGYCKNSGQPLALTPRAPINQVTHYLDASQIYGSTEEEVAAHRAYFGGLLDVNTVGENGTTCSGGQYEPLCFLPEFERTVASVTEKHFYAGDTRVMVTAPLTATHVLFASLHNYLAELLSFNSDFNSDDDILYEEARRIVIALLQSITYQEYLPLVLGSDAMQYYNLSQQSFGQTSFYDKTCNPTASVVFSSAAFRHGHSLVKSFYKLAVRDMPLPEAFNNHDGTTVANEYPSDHLLGLSQLPSEKQDHFVVDEMTNKLFAVKTPSGNFRFGTDLVALNNQRGRDHGLPGYNYWREFCGLSTFSTFEDLAGHMPDDVIAALESIYKNPGEIDLYAAGLSEISKSTDGLLGPTFTCLLGLQFKNYKYGDRMWFEDGSQPHPFTPDQLAVIRSTKLSSIICHLTNVHRIQPEVMKNADSGSNQVDDCNNIIQGTIFTEFATYFL